MPRDKPLDAGQQDFEIVRDYPETRIVVPGPIGGGSPDQIIVRRGAQAWRRLHVEVGNVANDFETEILAQHRLGFRLPVFGQIYGSHRAIAQFVARTHIGQILIERRGRAEALEIGNPPLPILFTALLFRDERYRRNAGLAVRIPDDGGRERRNRQEENRPPDRAADDAGTDDGGTNDLTHL